jgi:hypothetical protein
MPVSNGCTALRRQLGAFLGTSILFAGCAPDGVYIIDMSLLIIAHLFLLRAIDSFKHSSRWPSANEDCSPARIHR